MSTRSVGSTQGSSLTRTGTKVLFSSIRRAKEFIESSSSHRKGPSSPLTPTQGERRRLDPGRAAEEHPGKDLDLRARISLPIGAALQEGDA